MPKPRTCPHCGIVIPTETGFYFDKLLNMHCSNCDEIAFLVEEEPVEVATTSVVSTTNTTTTWPATGYGGHGCGFC